jgi:hypothetical protein
MTAPVLSGDAQNDKSGRESIDSHSTQAATLRQHDSGQCPATLHAKPILSLSDDWILTSADFVSGSSAIGN